MGLLRLVALLALLLLDAPPQQAQAQPFGGTTWCNESVVYDTNTNGVRSWWRHRNPAALAFAVT